jgi:hypothetical protein
MSRTGRADAAILIVLGVILAALATVAVRQSIAAERRCEAAGGVYLTREAVCLDARRLR